MEQQPPATPGAPDAPALPDAPAMPPPAPPSAWAAPPTAAPSAWVAAPVSTGRGSVTGLAKLGALVLILFGLFWTLIGALLLLAAGMATTILEQIDLEGLGDAQFADIAGGVIALFGIVIIVVAVVELLTGIFAWRGSGFARVLGILYGLGFGSVTLLAALSPSARDSVTGTGATLIPLAIGIAYLYTALIFIVRWKGRA